jgi:hypothetical protein
LPIMRSSAPAGPCRSRISRILGHLGIFLLIGLGALQAKEWPEVKEVVHYRYRLLVKQVPASQEITVSWQTTPEQSSTVQWYAGAKGPTLGSTSYGELPSIIVMVRSPFMNGNLSTTPRLMYGKEVYDGRWLTDQDRKEGCPRLQYADDKPLMPMEGTYVIQAQEGSVFALFSKWEKVWMGNKVVTRTRQNFTSHKTLKMTVKELSGHESLEEQTIQLLGPKKKREEDSASTITEQVTEQVYESKFMDGKLNLKWDIQLQVSRRIQTYKRGAYRIDPDKGCGYYEYIQDAEPRYEDYVPVDEIPSDAPPPEAEKAAAVTPPAGDAVPVLVIHPVGEPTPVTVTPPVSGAAPVIATPPLSDGASAAEASAADTPSPAVSAAP